MDQQISLLPTGTSMNPAKPETAHYFDPATTIIVFRDVVKKGRLRIGTTSGGDGGYPIGSCWDLRHDQQMYSFGIYEVIGSKPADGSAPAKGEIPDRKITHCVYK